MLLVDPASPAPSLDALDTLLPWYPCPCSKALGACTSHQDHSRSPPSIRGEPIHQSSYDFERSPSVVEAQSEDDLDPRSVPSPDETTGDRTMISPLDDMSSFVDQIVRMAKALGLKHASSEPRTKDPLMQALFTPDTGPVALPCLQGLQEVVFAAWVHPASTALSGRSLEGLYKIIDSDCLLEGVREEQAVWIGEEGLLEHWQAMELKDSLEQYEETRQ
ncbi:UNVERIFIED_CONTAM: hypothetical protein K2H54_056800 [Gekko kuhli]